MSSSSLKLFSVPDIPLIGPGDDLAELILQRLEQCGQALMEHDVVVIAQKVVSKAENRIIYLDTVEPTQEALDYAKTCDKDPRLVQLILSESKAVLRCKPGVIIVEHQSGLVLANAGIDHSNVSNETTRQQVSLLPEDADASARNIRNKLQAQSGKNIAVIISDSIGRAWRLGTVGVAIGAAGITALQDLRGAKDLFGKILQVSETADIDALASAAGLLMGEAHDSAPVVVIRGQSFRASDQNAKTLLRPLAEDMFR